MHKPQHKGMEAPNVRETRERGEREQHTEEDGPFQADENPERIIEEEASNAEKEKEEKLSARTQ